ncbi:hypothetical protein [Acaricomes phytoseiuli]|uniref:hypothetical protein n=1 Tax=Acaricomes phytoseiuli TaxID=291968 RepID=UPI0003A96C31|nr:hypothetical protein [Acaricomes phytoseiuli]
MYVFAEVLDIFPEFGKPCGLGVHLGQDPVEADGQFAVLPVLGVPEVFGVIVFDLMSGCFRVLTDPFQSGCGASQASCEGDQHSPAQCYQEFI